MGVYPTRILWWGWFMMVQYMVHDGSIPFKYQIKWLLGEYPLILSNFHKPWFIDPGLTLNPTKSYQAHEIPWEPPSFPRSFLPCRLLQTRAHDLRDGAISITHLSSFRTEKNMGIFSGKTWQFAITKDVHYLKNNCLVVFWHPLKSRWGGWHPIFCMENKTCLKPPVICTSNEMGHGFHSLEDRRVQNVFSPSEMSFSWRTEARGPVMQCPSKVKVGNSSKVWVTLKGKSHGKAMLLAPDATWIHLDS